MFVIASMDYIRFCLDATTSSYRDMMYKTMSKGTSNLATFASHQTHNGSCYAKRSTTSIVTNWIVKNCIWKEKLKERACMIEVQCTWFCIQGCIFIKRTYIIMLDGLDATFGGNL